MKLTLVNSLNEKTTILMGMQKVDGVNVFQTSSKTTIGL